MKISLNKMRFVNQKYGCSDNSELKNVDELVRKIGAQLGEVEEVSQLGPMYDGVLVARVIECVKHPNADKLQVCKIDDGGKAKGVKRDGNGLVQVVCGAPNCRQGLTVAWIPPGAVVPSTYGKEEFKLEARELRGKVSNGMLASPSELALSDNHDGILEIEEDEVGQALMKPGTPFKELYGLDDTIIDIENKMFTHRPDCFGMLGVARELAGISDKPFKSPQWYLDPPMLESTGDPGVKGLSVTVEISKLVPRYQAVVISGVKIGPSPVWLQTYLSRVGAKPINNVVDITNYLMLTTGQPLHAFDFDKVAVDGQAKIVVRHPNKGEKLSLLDGRTITPRKDAILICDQDKPIALGGVMGGNNSEIDQSTTRIIIESANFDMYNIRRTSMEHGIFTDAVTRFNKGQSPWQTNAVLHKAAEVVKELIPSAHVVGKLVDVQKNLKKNPTVQVSAAFINERLGLDLKGPQIAKRLQNVEFDVEGRGDQLAVTAPFWRTDVAIPEDVVEEVGRLYGYDHLPLVLPRRDLTPVNTNAGYDLKKRLRDILSRGGANEVLTYSFVHESLMTKTGQDPKIAYKLNNALSPDLQYFRLTGMPSLLDKVHGNIKAGYDQFALFEMNKTHNNIPVDDRLSEDPGIPQEHAGLAFVFTANDKAAKQYHGAPLYQAKAYIDYLCEQLGIEVSYKPYNSRDVIKGAIGPYDFERTAEIYIHSNDAKPMRAGFVGEFRAEVLEALKLPAFTAGFEIELWDIEDATRHSTLASYEPLAKYPRTQQDISFKVAEDTSYGKAHEVLSTGLTAAAKEHGYNWTLDPLDIYHPKAGVKHMAMRITLWHPDRTLQTGEVNKLLDGLAKTAATKLKATRL